MFTSKMKRLLSLALALIMVASLVPYSAFATEETPAQVSEESVVAEADATVAEETIEAVQESENVLYVQGQIDRILTTYLGTTSATKEELETLVAQMDEITRMDVQFEILILEEDMGYMELTEAEQAVLVANNAVLCDLCDVLLAYPMDGVFYTTVKLFSDTLSLADTASSISASGDTVTVKAKGSLFSAKTNTVTVSNLTSGKRKLSFTYEVSNAASYDIAGITSVASGVYSVTMEAGSTIQLVVKSSRNSTATLTLTNISFIEAKDASNVTFQYDNTLGSVTVGGAAVTPGTQQEIAVTGVELKATANSGATFLGWIDQDNVIISQSATYTLQPADDMTVQAVFATTAAWFQVNGNALYQDLNAAVTAAQSATNKTIVLANNGTLPAGDYTIPAGITLLVPCDTANTVYTTEPQTLQVEKYAATPTAYRTLTMATGANLTVNGAVSIGGSIATNTPNPGAVYGAVGFVKMQEGSNITINNGANLYAWGFIMGAGSVTVENGGTVYEDFQVTDFRGGSNTSSIVGDDDTYHAFPFNQYYIQNIEVPMTLKAGAVENGYMAVYITLAGIQGSAVPFIGPNGMFNVTEGYIVKDYNEAEDRLEISVRGKFQMKSLSITMKLAILGSTTIESQNYDLPVNNNISVYVYSGSEMTITQDISLLPGTELIVEDGVNVTLGSGKRIIIYDADEWTGKGFAHIAVDVEPVKYAPGKTLVGTRNVNVDAKVVLGGNMNMEAGAVYATAGGADVTGVEGAVLKLKLPTTNRKAYQVVQTNGYVMEEVPLTNVPLKNADGTTLIADLPDGVYTYKDGKWNGECLHVITEAITTQATCAAPGVKTFSCGCGYSYTEEIAQLTHTEEALPAVAATCSATGLTAGVKCSVCGDILTAQQVIAKLPHTEVVDAAVAATCDTAGLTEGKHCSVCNEVLVAQEEIPALGHTVVVEDGYAATCTAAGLTDYKYCSVCNTVIAEHTEIPALGHTEVVDAAVAATCTATGLTEGKHCSVCNEVLVAQEEIPALGHTEVVDAAVAATCTATGLTEGKHCSVCNEVLVAQNEIPELGHDHQEAYFDAVNGNPGYIVCTCTRCDYEVTTYTYAAKNGEEKYKTLQAALDAYESGVIQLQTNADSLEVTKAAVIDLNGFDIATVTATAELTVLDAQTEDYSVADGVYGKLVTVTGNVASAEGYIAITEEDGTSYHKVSLKVDDMTLRGEDAGIYYNCTFSGDEMVAGQVTIYGVVLSLQENPEVGATGSAYSVFHQFATGEGISSTYLQNVMKEGLSATLNNSRANLQVYGRPYIQIGDSYIYGETKHRSFCEQVELIDEKWSELTPEQQTEVLDMYSTFRDAMADWNITNIKAASAS